MTITSARERCRAVTDDFNLPLELLLDHYGIPGGLDDPANGWRLALALAREHPQHGPRFRVPFFRRRSFKRSRGNPSNPEAAQRWWTAVVVIEAASEDGRSARGAARALAAIWRAQGVSTMTGNTLYRRYLRLRKEGMTEPMRRLIGTSGPILSDEECDRLIKGMKKEALMLALGKE